MGGKKEKKKRLVAINFMIYSNYVELTWTLNLHALYRTSQNLGTENQQVYLSYVLVLTVQLKVWISHYANNSVSF